MDVITCPWCGTNYTSFQQNCQNCGGVLPLPFNQSHKGTASLTALPPAPRQVPRAFIKRMLLSDGWMIAGGIFAFIGAIFSLVGLVLVLAIITLPVGLPFFLLGLAFLAGGVGVCVWRYSKARQIERVLQMGNAVIGEINEIFQNMAVSVNGRNPWVVRYHYRVGSIPYEGNTTSLKTPPRYLQEGDQIYVLYMRENPTLSTLYPPLP